MTQAKEVKMQMLGNYGERIVGEVLRSIGYDVVYSDDPYDRNKDMTVNGSTVEIKTQVPFYSEKAFSINAKQLRKCNSVDYVVFVAVPSLNMTSIGRGNSIDGNIYTVDPQIAKWRSRTTNDGRSMYLMDINQPGVTLCHKITNQKILNSLTKLTTSKA
jgi:hypothetical protein